MELVERPFSMNSRRVEYLAEDNLDMMNDELRDMRRINAADEQLKDLQINGGE